MNIEIEQLVLLKFVVMGQRLYKRVCPSVRLSVGRSVHPLVGLLVIDPDQIISHVGLLRLFSSPVASPIVDMMRENIFIKTKKNYQEKNRRDKEVVFRKKEGSE